MAESIKLTALLMHECGRNAGLDVMKCEELLCSQKNRLLDLDERLLYAPLRMKELERNVNKVEWRCGKGTRQSKTMEGEGGARRVGGVAG